MKRQKEEHNDPCVRVTSKYGGQSRLVQHCFLLETIFPSNLSDMTLQCWQKVESRVRTAPGDKREQYGQRVEYIQCAESGNSASICQTYTQRCNVGTLRCDLLRSFRAPNFKYSSLKSKEQQRLVWIVSDVRQKGSDDRRPT